MSEADMNPAAKIMMQALDQSSELMLKPILSNLEGDIEKFLAVQSGNNKTR